MICDSQCTLKSSYSIKSSYSSPCGFTICKVGYSKFRKVLPKSGGLKKQAKLYFDEKHSISDLAKCHHYRHYSYRFLEIKRMHT